MWLTRLHWRHCRNLTKAYIYLEISVFPNLSATLLFFTIKTSCNSSISYFPRDTEFFVGLLSLEDTLVPIHSYVTSHPRFLPFKCILNCLAVVLDFFFIVSFSFSHSFKTMNLDRVITYPNWIIILTIFILCTFYLLNFGSLLLYKQR